MEREAAYVVGWDIGNSLIFARTLPNPASKIKDFMILI